MLSTVATSKWKCRSEDTFKLERLEPTCGGEPLREVAVTEDLFRASAMHAEAPVAFKEMKVAALKAELVARGAARSGAKGVLQSRLNALIVQRPEWTLETRGTGRRRTACEGCATRPRSQSPY